MQIPRKSNQVFSKNVAVRKPTARALANTGIYSEIKKTVLRMVAQGENKIAKKSTESQENHPFAPFFGSGSYRPVHQE